MVPILWLNVVFFTGVPAAFSNGPDPLSPGDWELASEVRADMKQRGVVPTVAWYNHFFELCRRAGRWDDVGHLIAEMGRQSLWEQKH